MYRFNRAISSQLAEVIDSRGRIHTVPLLGQGEPPRSGDIVYPSINKCCLPTGVSLIPPTTATQFPDYPGPRRISPRSQETLSAPIFISNYFRPEFLKLPQVSRFKQTGLYSIEPFSDGFYLPFTTKEKAYTILNPPPGVASPEYLTVPQSTTTLYAWIGGTFDQWKAKEQVEGEVLSNLTDIYVYDLTNPSAEQDHPRVKEGLSRYHPNCRLHIFVLNREFGSNVELEREAFPIFFSLSAGNYPFKLI